MINWLLIHPEHIYLRHRENGRLRLSGSGPERWVRCAPAAEAATPRSNGSGAMLHPVTEW